MISHVLLSLLREGHFEKTGRSFIFRGGGWYTKNAVSYIGDQPKVKLFGDFFGGDNPPSHQKNVEKYLLLSVGSWDIFWKWMVKKGEKKIKKDVQNHYLKPEGPSQLLFTIFN